MRMKNKVPKQFLMLYGQPVVMHSIRVFYRYDPSVRIILVLPEEFIENWKLLCKKHAFMVLHEIKPGGENRFESVKKGIDDIPDDCLVAIHDGVRPLVSIHTIDNCFKEALKSGNAVPCMEIPETLRRIESHGNIQVDREKHRLIQTPQVFKGSVLKSAYNQENHKYFTDDASVVESLGYEINLVKGNAENIKITREHDLIIAEAIMRNEKVMRQESGYKKNLNN